MARFDALRNRVGDQRTERMSMHITVAVSEHEFTEMDTSPEMLKESIRNALMRGIEDECGTLYLSDVSVEVNVIPASASSHGDC